MARYCPTCGEPKERHGIAPMLGMPRPCPIVRVRAVKHRDGTTVPIFRADRRARTRITPGKAMRH